MALHADAFRLGRTLRTRQAYGRGMTLFSLFRHATDILNPLFFAFAKPKDSDGIAETIAQNSSKPEHFSWDSWYKKLLALIYRIHCNDVYLFALYYSNTPYIMAPARRPPAGPCLQVSSLLAPCQLEYPSHIQSCSYSSLISCSIRQSSSGSAVAELLNFQLCTIQFVSFLAVACILIYFFCLKIELTKNVAWVLIVSDWCQFKYIMLCYSKETILLTWYDYMTGNLWSWTRERSVNDFNHGADIRTATFWCVLCSIIFHIEVQVNVFHIEVVVNGNFQSKVLLRKRNLMRWE